MAQPKMTLPTQLVLRALMDDPAQERYGLELCSIIGLASGTIHPILARLENVGWLHSRWEDVDPGHEGRPRRRYYRLNPNSIGMVSAALHRSEAGVRALGRIRPGLAGGK